MQFFNMLYLTLLFTSYRDYKNTSDPDTSDSDFDPHDYSKSKRRKLGKAFPSIQSEEVKIPKPSHRSKGNSETKIV